MKTKTTFYILPLFFLALSLISTSVYPQALTGNKTIGVGGDYTSLSLAITDLNTNGVGPGGVTFLFTDASYVEPQPLTITAPGSSSNPITFKPATGTTPKINISAATLSQWGIQLNNTGYIVFDGSNNNTDTRDLTVELINTHGSVFFITNSTDNAIIKNCIIKSFANDSTADIGIYIKGAGCDSTLIQNNHIYNAYEGIDIYTPASSGLSTGTKILNNLVGDSLEHISTYGIYCANSQNLEITGNEVCYIIRDKKGNTPEGIFIPTLLNQVLKIEKNKIHDLYSTCFDGMGGKGIYLMMMDNNPAISIINNMIWHLGTGPSHSPGSTIDTYAPIGIYMYRSSINITSGIIRIQHNSIYITPDNVNGLNLNMKYAMGVYIGVGIGNTTAGSGVIDFRNNIIQISIGETGTGFSGSEAYGIYSTSTTKDPFTAGSLNYNIYQITGQDANYIGRFKPLTTGLTFAAWKSATGQDANSLNQDPMFTSVSDLHIQNGQFVNGTNLSILDDIDGNTRSAIPDIGADEFDITISVNDFEKENDMVIFPNPATDLIKINGIPENAKKLSLIDLLGNVILTEDVNKNNSVEIRFHTISKGMYLLQILTDSGKITKKIIVK